MSIGQLNKMGEETLARRSGARSGGVALILMCLVWISTFSIQEATAATTTVAANSCPTDGGTWIYSSSTGRCYSYVSTPSAFNNLVCVGLTSQADARLVDIRSKTENDIVLGMCNVASNTACMETMYQDSGTSSTGYDTCCCTGYSTSPAFTFTPSTSDQAYYITDAPSIDDGKGTCTPTSAPNPGNKFTDCVIGKVYSGKNATTTGKGPTGMGACWIGAQRSGGLNTDANYPVQWTPQVAGQSVNINYTRWQNDIPPYPVPVSSPSLKNANTQLERFWAFEKQQLNNAVPRCVSMYHRTELGRWLVTWCERLYPSVCVVDALCPGSYNRTQSYAVSSSGAVTTGTCSLCPGGTYRPFGVKNELDCLNCGAGYFGRANDTNRVDSTCSGFCPRGTYCVAGTEVPTFCNPGTYGVPLNGTKGWTTQEEACAFCQAGYYCAGTGETTATPQNQICAAGRCGYAGATDSQCSSACKAGYLCLGGKPNACPDAPYYTGIYYSPDCGNGTNTNVYCPAGSTQALTIPSGYFGYGGGNTNTSAGAVAPCTIGSKCKNGVRYSCDAGTYQDEIGQTECKICREGFYCPPGSTSASQEFCALTTDCPASYYCPAGTTTRLRVPSDKLALPLDAPSNQKSNYTDCPLGQTCLCGIATSYLSWNNASCPNGIATTSLPELYASRNSPFTFIANLVSAPQTGNMSVSYSLVSQKFFDSSVTACQSTVNDGIFAVNPTTGTLLLNRYSPNARNASAALQYEACPPNADIRYTIMATATARDNYTNFNVSITCQLTVRVLDMNDQPIFPNPVEYRVIDEKSLGNTPAGRCWNVPGCPNAPSFSLLGSPEVAATDEDQFGQTSLFYSFVGTLNSCQDKFKINSCTGLISQKTGSENVISFIEPCLERYTTNLKRLNFTVQVQDDGNGNASNTLTDVTQVYLYIHNVNDPPMILNDSAQANLHILENALPGTATTPPFLSVYDEDEGDVLTQSILVGDSSAFTIEPFPPYRIVTTEIGAAIIDYESAKKQYFVTIQVSDGQLSTSKIFAITVLNVNEAPVFDPSTTVFYIPENAAVNQPACRDDSTLCSMSTPQGIAANQIRTTDPDGLATDKTTYTLLDNAQGRFAIHPTSGYIYLASLANSIDFEDSRFDIAGGTGRGFRITVQATSDGVGCDIVTPASSVRNVTVYLVDVNEKPTFVNPSQNVFRVPESWSVGQPLDFIVSATDPDNADLFLLGTLAPVQTLTFSLNDTAPTSNSGHGLFLVANGATAGQARLSLGSTRLDYETAPSCPGFPSRKCYLLNIKVEDNGNPVPLSNVLQIEIDIFDVNEPPYFTSAFTVTIPETVSLAEYTAQKNVTASTTLQAQDPDAGNNAVLAYDIVGGTGQGSFSVGYAGGVFTVTKLANTVLNYEQVTSWTLVVRVQDQGGDSTVATQCSVQNGVTVGCQQGGSQCLGDRCYEICPTYANSTTNITSAQVPRVDTYFCQDLTGVNGLVKTSQPFRESAITTVTVQVLNQNDAPYVVDATFFGLAHPDFRSNPTCALRGVVAKTLADNNQAQVAIHDISWFDEDSSSGGPAAPVHFGMGSCSGASQCLWSSGFVLSNTATGDITLPGLINLVVNTTYSAMIDIFDSAGATSSCAVNITATDSNLAPDLGPDVTTIGVLENQTSPFIIVATWPNRTIAQIDPDTQRTINKDVLTFSMSLSSVFALNSNTGGLNLTGRLDYETAQSHVLIIRVADASGATDVATMTVPIIDVNEPPFWTLSPIDPITLRKEYTLNESTATGYVIDNLAIGSASDPDVFTPLWSTLTYSLVACTPGPCPFSVNATGHLLVSSGGPTALNYEGTTNKWVLTLRVRDGGGLFTDTTVGVSLLDINESPTIQSGAILNVMEGSSGTALLDLTGVISDPDIFDPVSSLTVNISSGGSGVFVIQSGVLRVAPNATLDYEQQQNYTINVRVTDSGGLFVTGVFYINVVNVNDVTVSSVTVVSGGQSATVLSCTGVNIVRFTGTNFGLVSWTPATAANISVTYRRIQSAGESVITQSPVYRATNCTVVSANNTIVECGVSAAGAGGLGIVWTLTVVSVPGTTISSDAISVTTLGMKYDAPTLTSVAGASAIPTLGNSPITLTGTCLGRPTDTLAFSQSGIGRDSYVEMFEKFSNTWKPLVNCSSTSSLGTTIVCTSVPGLGGQLRWRASIAGQLFEDITSGAYGVPVVASVSKTILQTSGLDSLMIAGTNFAPTFGAVPERVYLQDDTYNLQYDWIGCTVTVPGRNLTCSSMQPGIGRNLKIRVIFASASSNDSTPTVSFQAPQLLQVQGDLSTTVGGDPVTVTGTNFGPICGVPGSVNCPYIDANYSRGTFSTFQNAVIVYRPTICAVTSQTKIICLTVPGTGANHKWDLRVAGQQATVSPTAGTTSYARPAVGAYDGPGSTNALTFGGQTVVVSGAHFGPVGGAPVTATYGDEKTPNEYSAVNCYVTTAHTEITCTTAPGAGKGETWTVFVDGQQSVAELSSYGAPQIYTISSFSRDDGGETVSITGLNFGPPSPGYLEQVAYGPSTALDTYDVTSSCHVTSHTTMTCTTMAGSGSNLYWKVKVRGQPNVLQSPATSYQTPLVQNLSILTGPTKGGYSATLQGIGFSLCDSRSTSRVAFGSRPVDATSVSAEAVSTGAYITFDTHSDCPLSITDFTAKRRITFLVPEMVDVSQASVGFVVDSPSIGTFTSPVTFLFTYQPPSITFVYAEPGPVPSSIAVSVVGQNFCKSELCCQLYLDGSVASSSVTYHNHDRITAVVFNYGTVQVRCPQGVTEVRTFDTPGPFVIGAITAVPQPSVNLGLYQFDTRGYAGGSQEEFFVFGIFFGAIPKVKVGSVACEVTEVIAFDCNNPSPGFPLPNTMDRYRVQIDGRTCTRVRARAPTGEGVNLPLTVESDASSTPSLADDPDFDFFSYAAPEITDLSAEFDSLQPTQGSTSVTLHVFGRNFGPTGGQLVFGDPNARYPILCTPVTVGYVWNHTEVRYSVPEGSGKDLAVSVRTVGGRLSVPFTGRTLSYQAPQINSWSIDGTVSTRALTQGGQVLRILGSNFGRPYFSSLLIPDFGPSPTVALGLTDCPVINATHNTVLCRIPEGEGANFALTVTQTGQTSGVAVVKFAYGLPDVTFLSPKNASTNATDPVTGLPIVLTILGSNFGHDELIVTFVTPMGKLLLGRRSSFYGWNDFLPGTNHTQILVRLPSYFGKNLNVSVVVAGQENIITPTTPLFSYNPPRVDQIVVNRRLSADLGGDQLIGLTSSCSPVKDNGNFTGYYERHQLTVQVNGNSLRVHQVFYASQVNQSDIACTPAMLVTAITVTGTFTDLGPHPALGCVNLFMETVATVASNPAVTFNLPASFATTVTAGTKGYGAYLKYDLYKFAFSAPTSESQALAATDAFSGRLEYMYEVEAASGPPSQTRKLVPTTGCYQYEPYDTYRANLDNTFLLGGEDIPRVCVSPALVTIIGQDFGTDTMINGDLAPEGSLRVYLVDENGVQYEASTTTTAGNQNLKCTAAMGCEQQNTIITFQAPMGAGRGLSVRIVLGNQETLTAPLVDYLPPGTPDLSPGTVFSGRQLMSGLGRETITIRGDNLGYKDSPVTVLFNNRPCGSVTWVSGVNEVSGKASLRCASPAGPAGFRSVFICVANQARFFADSTNSTTDFSPYLQTSPTGLVATEQDVALQYGETFHAWSGTVPPNQTYSRMIMAFSVARCPPGYYGRIGEVCLPCPHGQDNPPASNCTGGLGLPVPTSGFSLIELPVSSARATVACPDERMNQPDGMPDVSIYSTCHQVVKCIPPEACLGAGQCADGYQYQYNRCQILKQNHNLNSTCRVYLDPSSMTYVGINADCRPGGTPDGQACTADNPLDCQSCQVVYDDSGLNPVPTGVCTCDMPVRCALCSQGTHFRINNECQPCPANPGALFAVFIIVALACVGLAYYIQKKNINLAFMSVMIDYFQVLAILATTNVPWPAFIRQILTIFTVFLASIDIVAPECLIPNFEFPTKFYMTELMPIVALLVLCFVHIFSTVRELKQEKKLKGCRNYFRYFFRDESLSRMVGIYVIILYVLYLQVTKRALDVFNCNPLDPDDGYSYTSFSSLSCDGGGLCRCDEPGGVQQSLVIPAIVALVVYTFGFPCAVAYVLRSRRSEIEEDQYLRAHGVGDSFATNPRAFSTRTKFQLMYMHFKPQYSFWMLIVIGRKFGIAFASLMFRGNATFQLAVILVILFFAFTVQVRFRPYLSKGEFPVVVKYLNDMFNNALNENGVPRFLELHRNVTECVRQHIELARREKLRRYKMGGGFWEDAGIQAHKHIIRSRTEKYFFDLNAVETNLLGTLILVVLCGVMFDSNQYQTRADTRWQGELIVILVLVLLFVSLVYIFLVVFNELFPQHFAMYCGKVFLRYQITEEKQVEQDDVVLDANPLFAATGPVGDKSVVLQRELQQMQKHISVVKRQNDELAAQIEETSKSLPHDLDETVVGVGRIMDVANPRFSNDRPIG